MAIGIVLIAKTVAAVCLVLLFRYSLQTALTIGASLAQIGEFSFILAGLGVSLGLMPKEGQSLIVVTSLFSIAINPILFAAIEPVRSALLRRFKHAQVLNRFDSDPEIDLQPQSLSHLNHHAIVVGYGRVGRRVVQTLLANLLDVLVIEQNRQEVAKLKEQGVLAIAGRGADDGVLSQAMIERASVLVIVISDALSIQKIVSDARAVRPNLPIVACTPYHEDADFFRDKDHVHVFFGEVELADAMASHVVMHNRFPKIDFKLLDHPHDRDWDASHQK